MIVWDARDRKALEPRVKNLESLPFDTGFPEGMKARNPEGSASRQMAGNMQYTIYINSRCQFTHLRRSVFLEGELHPIRC
jgi:hypothetical protein